MKVQGHPGQLSKTIYEMAEMMLEAELLLQGPGCNLGTPKQQKSTFICDLGHHVFCFCIFHTLGLLQQRIPEGSRVQSDGPWEILYQKIEPQAQNCHPDQPVHRCIITFPFPR